MCIDSSVKQGELSRDGLSQLESYGFCWFALLRELGYHVNLKLMYNHGVIPLGPGKFTVK